jgi:hypothetical protein
MLEGSSLTVSSKLSVPLTLHDKCRAHVTSVPPVLHGLTSCVPEMCHVFATGHGAWIDNCFRLLFIDLSRINCDNFTDVPIVKYVVFRQSSLHVSSSGTLRHVDLVRPEVSKELTASIIRVQRIGLLEST